MFNLFKSKKVEVWNSDDENQYSEFLNGKLGESSKFADFVIIKGKLRPLVEEKIKTECWFIDYKDDDDETIINF